MMVRALCPVLALLVGGCAAGPGNPCEEAAELVAECTGNDPVAPPECTAEAEAAAKGIIDGGCDAFDPGKADGWTQFCQPHLKKWFGFWPDKCNPSEVSCEGSLESTDTNLCNGSAALCDRPYDEITYGTSHNAFNVATLEFFRPNQSYRMFRQLEDGMRALMLDTHPPEDGSDELRLCHADCKHGSQTLVEGLREIKTFLDCNPREVVTLLIEPTVGGGDHVAAFEAAGLAELTYSHTPGKDWPALGEILDTGKQLVVFAEDCKGDLCPAEPNGPSWYHDLWEYAFDNEYHAERVSDFNCELKRGSPDNSLFGLNHFITVEPFDKSLGGDAWASVFANKRDALMDHITECEGVYGRVPNFLSVDFYDSGATLAIVNELNQR
jgi:hypothetical protein